MLPATHIFGNPSGTIIGIGHHSHDVEHFSYYIYIELVMLVLNTLTDNISGNPVVNR